MEIIGNQWKSMKINENQWKINEHQWKSMKINQNRAQNQPKNDPKRAWVGPGGYLGSKVAPGADLTPKTSELDPLGAPKLGAKIDPKSSKNRSKIQQISRSFFWLILEPSWGRFSQIWGSKMEPKLVQNRSQERSWSKCENVKKPLVFVWFLRIRGAQNRSKIALKTTLS